MSERRFPYVLTVACGAVLAVLIALGAWQVQRLSWKERLIDQAARAESLPPVPLSQAFAEGEPDFRRVRMQCPGIARAPYVELRAIEDGQAGVRLISACRPSGFEFPFLVDRGFVADEISARPPVEASSAPFVVEGVLRETPAPGWMTPAPHGIHFYGRDPQAMSAALGLDEPAGPYVVFATTSTNPEWLALRPSAPPAAFSNNHLGYAITWFGLAAALVGVYVALIRRRMKR
ncbi:SURF1 family protein [Brevundimonas sp.]|uniref:SURF1 family protein n=1 Tax=Brevundimonas sp. TaxID=1871086 RepID=UPI0025F117E8|nr:SURF1 family protein [Brevundimonas sp.]